MGASLGETGPFACSCLPFPGPQRPIKGTLIEDDKRQPTPLLSVCASPRHSVSPPKVAHFFFIEHSFSIFSHRLMFRCRGVRGVKGWPSAALLRADAQTSEDEPQHVCYGLPLAKWQRLDTEPPLSFRFISGGFKSHRVWLRGWFQVHPSEPQRHFQFQGC